MIILFGAIGMHIPNPLKVIFYPISMLLSRVVYPPSSFLYAKYPIDEAFGSYTPDDKSGGDGLILCIPGRHQIEFDWHDEIRSKAAFEYILPGCYSQSFSPFSLEEWSKRINHRINLHTNTNPGKKVTVLAWSLGGMAAAISAATNRQKNVDFILINTPSSIPKLLYNHPAFEISMLMLLLCFVSGILLFLGHGGVSPLSITSYIMGGSAISVILISHSILYLKNHNYYEKCVYLWGCLPDFEYLPDKLASILLCKWQQSNNAFFNLCLFVPLLIAKTLAAASLIAILAVYVSAYIGFKCLHIPSHILVYCSLWLVNAHQDVKHLLNGHSSLGKVYAFHATNDEMIPKDLEISPRNPINHRVERREIDGSHSNISLQGVLDTYSSGY